MPPITTFQSSVLSLWQSAINEVLSRREADRPRVLGEEPAPSNLSSTAPIMLESIEVADALLSGRPVPDAASSTRSTAS